MKLPQLTLALCFVTALSACSSDKSSSTGSASLPGNPSIDTSGNCTTQYVSDYNNVVHEARMAKSYLEDDFYSDVQKRNKLKKIQTACQIFFSTHGNITCRAEVNYVTKQVSGADVKTACDAVNNFLAPTEISPPAISPSNNNKEDNEKLADLPDNQIKIKIIDAEKVKIMLREKDGNLVMVDGEVGTVESLYPAINPGSAICFLAAAPLSEAEINAVRSGKKMHLSSQGEHSPNQGQRQLIMHLENTDTQDLSFSIGCLKSNDSPYTLKEIRDAARGILEINLN